MKKKPQGCFSLREAANHSDLSTYMVEYLCRNGLVVPSGSADKGRGHPNWFTFGDVVMMRTLKQMLSAGISVARLRKSIERLRERHAEITKTGLPGRFLATDGNAAYFYDELTVENLTESGQLEFGFVIDMNKMRHSVQNRMATGMRSLQRRPPARTASR